MSNLKFLNLTELDDTTALEKVEQLRDLYLLGEHNRIERIEKDAKNIRLWNNEIWSQKDLDFFETLDITPYQFAVQRPLINNLIYRQRRQPVKFDVVPSNLESYVSHRRGKDEYVAKHLDEFDSIEEAERYYDEYADDEYAKAITAVLNNVRLESKAKYVESSCFQQGLISGLDILKAVYSRKYNREGGIEITRRPQRAIIYDESSVEYDLQDIEFIGETHLLYKSQLISQYPEYKAEIDELFEYYTNIDKRKIHRLDKEWKNFYNFTYGESSHESKVKVAELWYLDTEPRFKIIDHEYQEEKIAEFGLEEEEITDALKSKILLEVSEQARDNPELMEQLMGDNAEGYIQSLLEQRFEITTTFEPIWYKAVFSFNSLFEFKRSPLPHGGHPYFPFFAQFTEGSFRGVMEDIRDVIVAINKALAFRELMMAHGAKGLVVVDEDTMIKSGYAIEDIADSWSQMGSIIALKLKGNRRLQDVFQTVTTVGQGLAEINAILQDYDNRLYQISGVNLAQLGVVERETPASGLRMQIAEGESNNGLIYDNFMRTLESFYHDKVIPLVVDYMKIKQNTVIRQIGDKREPWINIDFDERFEVFEQAVRNGEYNLVLTPVEDNPRVGAERSARYMQMAMAGMLDPEVALEFSDDPNRFKIIQKNRKKQLDRARDQAAMMFDQQTLMQVMGQHNVGPQQAKEILDNLYKERIAQMAQEKNDNQGKAKQMAQGGMGGMNIQAQATESQRAQSIENNTFE